MSSFVESLLLHPLTRKQIKYFLQKPKNPLLILGERGSGKRNLAYALARNVLGLKTSLRLSLDAYYFHAKPPDNRQDISIDTVREIKRFLRLKTPGNSSIRRVVLIEDADFLSSEAQNALLKILEEPNDDTLFLLTAPYKLSLLPTIVSRCQHIWTYPVSLEQAIKYFGQKYNRKKIESAWRLSQGNSSLMTALLTDDDSHPLKQAVEQTKSFLKQTRYDRLLSYDKLSESKDQLNLFLEALSKVLTALHYSAINKHRARQTADLLKDRKLVYQSLEALVKNSNIRLIYLNLVLNLNS